MFTADEIDLKRRQLATLRSRGADAGPDVAAAIARLVRETATDEPQDITAPSVVDQLAATAAELAAARDRIAELEGQLSAVRVELNQARTKAAPKKKRKA